LQDAAGPLTDRDHVWHKERAVAVPVASVPNAAALVVSDEGEQLHVSSAISSTAGCACRGSARSWPWVRTLSARSPSIIGSTLAGARMRSTRCLTCWRRSGRRRPGGTSQLRHELPRSGATTPLWRRSTPPQRVKPVAALVVSRRALLLRMRRDQRRLDINRQPRRRRLPLGSCEPVLKSGVGAFAGTPGLLPEHALQLRLTTRGSRGRRSWAARCWRR